MVKNIESLIEARKRLIKRVGIMGATLGVSNVEYIKLKGESQLERRRTIIMCKVKFKEPGYAKAFGYKPDELVQAYHVDDSDYDGYDDDNLYFLIYDRNDKEFTYSKANHFEGV